MSLKNIATAVLLLAVIAAAVAIAVTRVRSETKQQPTYLQMEANRLATKIDMKSLEVFSETDNDWTTKYAPDKSGHFKNPKTGEYTMVEPMTCASCGQMIPTPDLPPLPRGGRGVKIDPKVASGMVKARMDFEQTYKCPKCGKPAFAPLRRPGMPSATATTPPSPAPSR